MADLISERIDRVSVSALDEVLGHQWKVLDDGFVRVVDYLGSDAAIVQAARVSYGVGTKTVHEDSGFDPLFDASPAHHTF